uniref:SF1_2 protein n=1 Tax=Fopius arisanus TaxID=64838 RepID=A0A0C9QAV2_9HYME
MNQSRNFTSLLNPSYLQNAQNSTASAAAAAAAAAAAVSAAIANGTPLNPSVLSGGKKRDADDGKQDRESREERRKRRKTRWGGSEHDKTFIPGMPTVLPTNLTAEQEQAYLCKCTISKLHH